MCPEEVIALVATISIKISKDTDSIEDLTAMASAFTLLADSLRSIVAQRINIKAKEKACLEKEKEKEKEKEEEKEKDKDKEDPIKRQYRKFKKTFDPDSDEEFEIIDEIINEEEEEEESSF
ncbi:MAG: hypothetical protein K0S47_4206 [Herbinix sp.]|jgi:cell shape-determining protein MreC|nr:hypothetical protein [Herbinix sp.]